MKHVMLIVLCCLTMVVSGQKAPHSDLIKPITNGSFLRVEQLSRYVLDVKEIKVDGVSYQYGSINLLAKVKRLFPTTPFSTFVVKNKNGDIYPLGGSKKNLFRQKSDDYQIVLNADTSVHQVEIDASILIISEQDHLNRNRYNKVAQGTLRADPNSSNSNVYIDECNERWIKQPRIKNVFHNILKTVKFLHPVSGGGEYETIRAYDTGEHWGSLVFSGRNITNDPEIMGTYNFGQTSDGSLHKFLDVDPHNIMGSNHYNVSYGESYLCGKNSNKAPTVFLIDRSGSMNGKGTSGKSKWEEAKEASLNSTASILSNTNSQQEVAFLTFSGGCSQDPTSGQSLNFNSSMAEVQQKLSTLGSPGGGTPLNEAVSAATDRLQQHVNLNTLQGKPKLIILSDGAATCGQIRPPQVYGEGTNQFRPSNLMGWQGDSKEVGNKLNTSVNTNTREATNTVHQIEIKYYTIGFDIRAGSKAERDLQYLANQSGGKYLNTQNEFELTRAFSKFFKVYQPKLQPANLEILKEEYVLFDEGVLEILNEDYESAKNTFQKFIERNPNDFHAIFNLALMYEASDYHSNAIAMYEEYLRLSPKAADKEWVLRQIQLLQNDKSHFNAYTKKILLSDLAYLKLHFEKIQNGESIALAKEFKGFIQEKKRFYETLPDKLGIINKSKRTGYKEVSRGLASCAKLIKRDPKNWDANATSPLSVIFFNLEKAIENF